MNLLDPACACLLLIDDNAAYVLFYVSLLIAAVFIRWIANSLDRRRIQAHVETAGGTVLDIKSRWFAPGWFGNRGSTYDVTYRTPQGRTVTATCMTGVFRGVYWISKNLPAGTSDDLVNSGRSDAGDPGRS
jgi:hypothetical protein